MTPARRKKVPKVKDFVAQCIKDGILSPSRMRDIYNEKYPVKKAGKLVPKSSDAFRKAIRRHGISATERISLAHEAKKSKELLDIEDYDEVRRYLEHSRFGASPIGKAQIKKTLYDLRKLWTWMSEMENPNPRDWTLKTLGECMLKHVGKKEDGQWKNKNTLLALYGAYNRTFQGKLPQGWSAGLKRPAGELKDFLEFDEEQEFRDKLTDTETMSKEGWDACHVAQLNMGCREGATGRTGILSLRWEDINYHTRRCSVRDKGKRGQPARLWTNVPLDLFHWLKGWDSLMRYHAQRFGYVATPSKHGQGRCFPVLYREYLVHFHKTRRRCTSRISGDKETLRPHIIRKTHAQYGKRIGVSLEMLCGDTKGGDVCDGRYGVGWTDPSVPLKYYLTREDWEYEEQDEKIQKRLADRVNPHLRKLGLLKNGEDRA